MGGLGYYNESLPITGVRHQHNTLISDSWKCISHSNLSWEKTKPGIPFIQSCMLIVTISNVSPSVRNL